MLTLTEYIWNLTKKTIYKLSLVWIGLRLNINSNKQRPQFPFNIWINLAGAGHEDLTPLF